jgi:DNA-binding transcriptional regulator YiaG
MPNIASSFKAEISRVARKEVRGEIESLKKAVAIYRSEIAALKRRVQELERSLGQLTKAKPKAPLSSSEPTSSKPLRFSAKGLISERKRLELSAEDLGLLLNTSSQSIYNWEAGDVRPRAKYLPAIVALKTLGKKDAAAVLAAVKSHTS